MKQLIVFLIFISSMVTNGQTVLTARTIADKSFQFLDSVTNKPFAHVGYVWTCQNSNGYGRWEPVTGVDTNSFNDLDSIALSWLDNTSEQQVVLRGPDGFIGNNNFEFNSGTNTLTVVGGLTYRDGNQTNGYVLTTDGSGHATWQPATGGGGTNYFKQTSTSLYPIDSSKFVGFGTTNPSANFDIEYPPNGNNGLSFVLGNTALGDTTLLVHNPSYSFYLGMGGSVGLNGQGKEISFQTDNVNFGQGSHSLNIGGGNNNKNIIMKSDGNITLENMASGHLLAKSNNGTSIDLDSIFYLQSITSDTSKESVIASRRLHLNYKILSSNQAIILPDIYLDSSNIDNLVLGSNTTYGNNYYAGGANLTAFNLLTGNSHFTNNYFDALGYTMHVLPGFGFSTGGDNTQIYNDTVIGAGVHWDLHFAVSENCNYYNNSVYGFDTAYFNQIDDILFRGFDNVYNNHVEGRNSNITILNLMGTSSLDNNYLTGSQSFVRSGSLFNSELTNNYFDSTSLQGFQLFNSILTNIHKAPTINNLFMVNKAIHDTLNLDLNNTAWFGGVLIADSFRLPNGAGIGSILSSDIKGNVSWQTPNITDTLTTSGLGSSTITINYSLPYSPSNAVINAKSPDAGAAIAFGYTLDALSSTSLTITYQTGIPATGINNLIYLITFIR